MAALGIDYEVDDVVFVAYPFPAELFFSPQSRTVTQINVKGTGDSAEVRFSDGDSVLDSNAIQTIFTTDALAAAAIVTDVIAKSAAAVALDATLSVASTAAQASTTLGRVS